MTEITEDVVTKLISVIDQGLTEGLGQPAPGQMCIEAAVCYALGLPHEDEPDCVAPILRSYMFALNDSSWSSNKARAEGLKTLGVLQLGTAGTLNEQEFVVKLALATINKILPIPLRRAGIDRAIIAACEEATTVANADVAARAARAAARAAAADVAAAAAASYAASAAADASAAAARAADAAARAADAAADAAASYAARAAAAADASAAAARAADAADAAAADAQGDDLLFMSAKIATDILTDMKVPGCQWMHLLEVPNPSKGQSDV